MAGKKAMRPHPKKKRPLKQRAKAPRRTRPAGKGLKETAAAIAAALSPDGHDPLLSGRACAAIYSGGAIKADVLEFVIREFAVEEIDRAMRTLGFRPREARTYASATSPFEVILAPAPLTVGDDVVGDARVVKVGTGSFKMLTPTDCVRHRLSMFYRWSDREALREAVAVARRQKVDLEQIRRWSEWEWASDRYREFTNALEKGF